MVDNVDLKLIELLKKNSRLSFADLGRKINLSPSSVRERVQKMEDEGIIKRYITEIDNKKIGLDLEAFILIKAFPGKLQYAIKTVSKFPEVVQAHRITGNQNIHLKVVVANQVGLQKLLDKLMQFGDTNTFLILSGIKN
jgi:Lrp/AsnC family leucine-responsive transcriptional regulator